MALTEFMWSVGVSVIQFLIGLLVAVFGVYFSIRVLDSLTKNLDEWKELKKGNVAVGILVAAIIVSVAIVIEGSINSLSFDFSDGLTFSELAIGLSVGLINVAISIVASMIGIYFAVVVFDQLTHHIDEFREVKKGNVAVAIVLGAVLLAISFVLKGTVTALVMTLNIGSFFGM